ncbi:MULTISPECIES: hypothetical protein [unclassified Acidovorax]|uniref:hypothetical protein n=1 Tax=unclassified Acidovorax TaxID=2684926 RepID=UPI0023DE4838|nr:MULTISPECIES: hypothetical protein [unclassified Acidovorax]GKS95002.1 hypothetical protein AVAK2825_10725 [Acidovorax sp. SUPP2825]GKS98533.1 hypothetical protein AVKW3434_04115 [Acidovorax sp. SUPP3434]
MKIKYLLYPSIAFFGLAHSPVGLTNEPTLPDVTVVASPDPFTGFYNSPGYYGTVVLGDSIDIMAQMSAIESGTSVCLARVSSGAKSTTKNSDVTNRWLAAQEVFNDMTNLGTLDAYRDFARDFKISMNGVTYNGFTVSYADGSRETWAINPGYKYSSIKLIDTPFPDSININKPTHRKCNQG